MKVRQKFSTVPGKKRSPFLRKTSKYLSKKSFPGSIMESQVFRGYTVNMKFYELSVRNIKDNFWKD